MLQITPQTLIEYRQNVYNKECSELSSELSTHHLFQAASDAKSQKRDP